jgi:DNA-binding NarL/FixJ family response regulator
MKIVIADDDSLVAVSLKTIISSGGIEVLAVGNSADQAVELYDRYIPDIILMDIRMGEKTGLDAAKEIISKHNEARVLFLTTFEDDEYILTALKIGAKGYILKQNYESIIPSLNAVMSGQTVFGEKIVSRLPEILNSNKEKKLADFGLSEKEAEIIAHVAKGLSNKEIASAMYLSEGTVRNYISIVLEKLNLRDRTQLAVFYYNHVK